MCLSIHISAGGYFISENKEKRRISYDKTNTSKTLCFIHDTVPPLFSCVNGSCSKEPLQISSRLTKSRYIKVSFSDWFDPHPEHGNTSLASGIESYELSIHEVSESTPNVLMRDTRRIPQPHNRTKYQKEMAVVLPQKNPVLYAILLEVKDRADNVRQARRFVLYDNTSVVTKNDRIPFRVDSASNNTKWQIHHDRICYSWKNRFQNSEYVKNNPLRPIMADSYPSIQGIYDQINGVLPTTGTKNVKGLTEFFYSLFRNEYYVISGKVENIYAQSLCLNTSMEDGDTFEFRLQSRDIMNNTLNDSVQVYIDSSVPEIKNIWLVSKTQKQLYVHHSSDLSSMQFEFKAFDVQSGVREIKWSFGIYENKTVLIEKAIGVTETNRSVILD